MKKENVFRVIMHWLVKTEPDIESIDTLELMAPRRTVDLVSYPVNKRTNFFS